MDRDGIWRDTSVEALRDRTVRSWGQRGQRGGGCWDARLPAGQPTARKQTHPGFSFSLVIQAKGNSGLGDFHFYLTHFLSSSFPFSQRLSRIIVIHLRLERRAVRKSNE